MVLMEVINGLGEQYQISSCFNKDNFIEEKTIRNVEK